MPKTHQLSNLNLTFNTNVYLCHISQAYAYNHVSFYESFISQAG